MANKCGPNKHVWVRAKIYPDDKDWKADNVMLKCVKCGKVGRLHV